MDPMVPGWSEVVKGFDSCQHSRVDLLLAAAVVVKLRCLVAETLTLGRRSRKAIRKVRESIVMVEGGMAILSKRVTLP